MNTALPLSTVVLYSVPFTLIVTFPVASSGKFTVIVAFSLTLMLTSSAVTLAPLFTALNPFELSALLYLPSPE